MSALTSWIVRRSNFPFTIPGKALGNVTAPSRASAEQVARRLFPTEAAICVEPGHSSEKLERALGRLAKLGARRNRSAARGHQSSRPKRLSNVDRSEDPS